MNLSHTSLLRRLALALFAAFFFFSAITYAEFKVLKAFPKSALDGANPSGDGVIVGNQYFGTTVKGGSNAFGVLYRINLDGTGFTKLKEFSNPEGVPDSRYPQSFGRLLASGGKIYGTLQSQLDCLYQIDYSGGGFIKLFEFRKYLSNSNGSSYSSIGSYPLLKFIDGNTIYGICQSVGTIFKIKTDGSGFQEIYTFQAGKDGDYPVDIADGGSVIYGITAKGGIADQGTIFRINKNGTGYSQLKYLSGETELNSIALNGGKIYICSAKGGGELYTGFIASINPDGTGYTELKKFGGKSPTIFYPDKMVIGNNQIYGVTDSGSFSFTEAMNGLDGGIFKMNLDGSGFSRLVPFSDSDYATNGHQVGGLILHNGVLYGTNESGGSGGVGILYSLNPEGSSGGGTPPTPTAPAMYGAVTFIATTFMPLPIKSITKTSGKTVTMTETMRSVKASISNAAILTSAVANGLIPEIKGYSIVSPDGIDKNLEFFAYKKGVPLVSLDTIIDLHDTVNLQDSTKVTTRNISSGSESINQSGSEKAFGTGLFMQMGARVSYIRNITFKTGTVRINGTTYTYYPSTSSAILHGFTQNGSIVEGKFSIAASKPIQVPVQ